MSSSGSGSCKPVTSVSRDGVRAARCLQRGMDGNDRVTQHRRHIIMSLYVHH